MAETQTQEVQTGGQTTEYKVTRGADIVGIVGIILGVIVALGPEILARAFEGKEASPAYVIAGGALSIASIIYKTLVNLGYIKSRTEVKVVNSGR